jgi:hypothetical protein
MTTDNPCDTDHITRGQDIAYVMEALADGDCCSIVGMSNIGKSFLLRNLRRPDLRQAFLGNAADNYIMVYVDFNLMWEMTDQGFYEVILRGITSEIDHLCPEGPMNQQVRQAYQNLINPASPFMIPVSFNEGLEALNPGWEQRLVLLFDEFDEPWTKIDRRTFLNLRALRDRYQGHLCYVTATGRRLSQVRPGREIGEFCELFTHHTRHLAPLPPEEARRFVVNFAALEEIVLKDQDITFVLDNADGHPGLLEATCHAVNRANVLATDMTDPSQANYKRLRSLLESDDIVRTECAKLWNDLSEKEQENLVALVAEGQAPGKSVTASLTRKHILVRDQKGLEPFCSLFAGFIRRQALTRHPERRGIRVDVEAGDVWVDGKLLPPLTDLEYRLLLLLYGNLGKICDKYRIVENVWGEDYIEQVDDARIEKLVSRLRQKLGEDTSDPDYLLTIRGRGYKLVSPELDAEQTP